MLRIYVLIIFDEIASNIYVPTCLLYAVRALI